MSAKSDLINAIECFKKLLPESKNIKKDIVAFLELIEKDTNALWETNNDLENELIKAKSEIEELNKKNLEAWKENKELRRMYNDLDNAFEKVEAEKEKLKRLTEEDVANSLTLILDEILEAPDIELRINVQKLREAMNNWNSLNNGRNFARESLQHAMRQF